MMETASVMVRFSLTPTAGLVMRLPAFSPELTSREACICRKSRTWGSVMSFTDADAAYQCPPPPSIRHISPTSMFGELLRPTTCTLSSMVAAAKMTLQPSISMIRGASVAKSSRKVSLCMVERAIASPPRSRTTVFSSISVSAFSCSLLITLLMILLTKDRSALSVTSHAAAAKSRGVVELYWKEPVSP